MHRTRRYPVSLSLSILATAQANVSKRCRFSGDYGFSGSGCSGRRFQYQAPPVNTIPTKQRTMSVHHSLRQQALFRRRICSVSFCRRTLSNNRRSCGNNMRSILGSDSYGSAAHGSFRCCFLEDRLVRCFFVLVALLVLPTLRLARSISLSSSSSFSSAGRVPSQSTAPLAHCHCQRSMRSAKR